MKLFIGLGNPGVRYEHTRHNVGFVAIDYMASNWNISIRKNKFQGEYGVGKYKNEQVILLKPLTFMNLSGECVRPFLQYYKIELSNIVVIYDDLDLDVGRVRLRQKGSSGGHNGIRSLISELKTEQFNRIKVGIGRPINSHYKIVDYVLDPFSENEIDIMEKGIIGVEKICASFVKKPFLSVVNEYQNKY